MGDARTPWGITVVMLLTMSAGALALAPPGNAETGRGAQVAGSLRLSDATVAPGAKVTLAGKLPPQRARTVRLQTRLDGSWTTLASKTSSRRGGFSFTVTSPAAAGDRDYPVAAPAARLGGRRYPAVVSPTRSLVVVTMVETTGGWKHSCALGSDQRAWCWGSNTYGELGDGTGGTSDGTLTSGPVPVIGKGWTDISASVGSTCGLKSDHTGWCWGDGATHLFGGDGWVPSPRQLSGEWSQLSAGGFYVCGVHTDGSGWCQGQNDDGQLGTTEPVNQTTPVQVDGTWLEIVAGGDGDTNTTCGIKADHSAWCWGSGGAGQLGNGETTVSSATPVRVAGDLEWDSLSVGGRHVCGTTTDGAGWCWGENTDGRLGDGTNLNERHAPVQVGISDSWASLDAGEMHTCGVTSDGTGWCFGWNQYGQLGNGSSGDDATQYYPVPDPTQLPGHWSDLDAGFHQTTGARSSGRAWAWGAAADGQTGQTSVLVSPFPVQVAVEP